MIKQLLQKKQEQQQQQQHLLFYDDMYRINFEILNNEVVFDLVMMTDSTVPIFKHFQLLNIVHLTFFLFDFD